MDKLREYKDILDDFINTTLGRAILEGENIGDVDGDIGIERVLKIDELEEEIIKLIIEGFRENNSRF